MTVGEKIKAARKKAGLTQKQIAQKMGVTEQGFQQWERGVRTPKLSVLKRIALETNTTIEYLVSDAEEKAAADVPTEDESLRRDMEEARADQRRHNEAIHKANQEVISAISSAVGGMKAIEKEINPEVLTPEELVNLGNTLAEMGKAVAAMRQSMNPPWMPGAYGYGA